MALDWGEKRIGIAVSDALGLIAQGLTTIQDQDYSARIDRIKEIIEIQQVKEVVIGLPLNLKGELTQKSKEIMILLEKLREDLNLPVYLQDERLSTKEIEKFLISSDMSRGKRKKVRDKLAAQIILQTYLDKKYDKN